MSKWIEFLIVLPFAIVLTWPHLVFVRMKWKSKLYYLLSILAQMAILAVLFTPNTSGRSTFWEQYLLIITLIIASVYYAYRHDKSTIERWSQSTGIQVLRWRWVPFWAGPKKWIGRGMCQIYFVSVSRSGKTSDGYLLIGTPLGLDPHQAAEHWPM